MREKSGLIITHAGHILKYVKADRAHVMLNGRKACSGETNEILNQIMKNGYEECVRRCQKN
jgi:Fe-S cluster assembly ATP-binding protein